ncbi:MAG TPA: cell division protein FtsZ [Anaerolineaceae bacterium]|nr:cell division protein FtsZ [Anaerolineaceae bacterium]
MQSKSQFESTPSIKVIGVGRGGCNAVNHMTEEGLKGIEFIAVNRDSQVLSQSKASKRLFIGELVHHGLDGGEDPKRAEKAAENSADELSKVIRDADMIFIVSTMGDGTGTGAAPVVARIAKQAGALTIGVVTQPFTFEGTRRMQKAVEGINNLRKHVDTLIVFSNDQIKEIDKHASLVEAFKVVDHKIFQGIKGISDLLTAPNLICLNLADLRSIMNGGKLAQMTVGKASGEDRARVATEKAISSCPMDFPMNKADGILVNFTCSPDLALIEIKLAIDLIRKSARPNVNILFGALINPDLIDEFQVTVFTNGYESLDARRVNRSFFDLDI